MGCSASSSCFAGETLIRVPVPTGGVKRIRDLRKGDRVVTSKGVAVVECVTVARGDFLVFRIGGQGGLTGTHPVKLTPGGPFVHPSGDPTLIAYRSDSVSNLVLSDRGCVFSENVAIAVTLAHGLGSPNEDGMVYHPVFGTEVYVERLKALFPDQYAKGLVDVTNVRVTRNPLTGWVESVN